MKWFTTRQAMGRRISMLIAAGLIFAVGLVTTSGRPRGILWARKGKAGLHEIELSNWLQDKPYEITWGDDDYQADAVIHLSEPVHVEWDRGTESQPQIEGRLRNFLRLEGRVLFMTVSESRALSVLERNEYLGKRLFTGHKDTVYYRRSRLIERPLNDVLKDLSKQG